ncbi:hypothetical protein FDF74_11445 [Clostridium niameyense]|uniref:Uncharacterized protein n=1 Tax=Clostridium niameyense TaxID=1622073 RepID=A0A6M0RBX2_9CLOT|nr:hypothetical protein [Clostridium niameyense]NEZ47795.1 hypothetical protein [Clostridium niameyense]
MKYISAEEFLSQPKSIQKVFLNWWQPEFGDLFLDDYSDCDSMINIVGCVPINKKHFEDHSGDIHYKTELTIPLFSEGQLRQFIEDKTSCILETNYEGREYKKIKEPGYCVYLRKGTDEDYIYPFENFEELGDDLLQAYWQVACKIAEKELN